MAASNINRVVITGNLTRDPELRSLQSGNSVCSLRIASNSRRKDGASGEWVDKPNYFSVTVWGAQGENCARFLSKGRPVCIDGRLDWREWQAQDGSKRESVEIVAESVQFLGSPGEGGGGQGGQARRQLQQRLRAALRRPRGHVGLRAPARRRSQQQRPGGRRHPVLGRSAPLRSLGPRYQRGPSRSGRPSRARSSRRAAHAAAECPAAAPGRCRLVGPHARSGRVRRGSVDRARAARRGSERAASSRAHAAWCAGATWPDSRAAVSLASPRRGR